MNYYSVKDIPIVNYEAALKISNLVGKKVHTRPIHKNVSSVDLLEKQKRWLDPVSTKMNYYYSVKDIPIVSYKAALKISNLLGKKIYKKSIDKNLSIVDLLKKQL